MISRERVNLNRTSPKAENTPDTNDTWDASIMRATAIGLACCKNTGYGLAGSGEIVLGVILQATAYRVSKDVIS